MYKLFGKKGNIKNEETSSKFPAIETMELWDSSELRRYDVLERPIINLFENDIEQEELIKGISEIFYLGDNINSSATEENKIIYGCELRKDTISSKNYFTLTPGVFVFDKKIHQIYPTCNIAARQIEKEAQLYTQNGYEYVYIYYENGTFKAEIKVDGYPKEIKTSTSGVVLISQIIAFLNGKVSLTNKVAGTTISIITPLEKFQLEPVFRHSGTGSATKYLKYKDEQIKVEDSAGSDFYFGTITATAATNNAGVVWKGLPTKALKDNMVTNGKLAKMGAMTVKVNNTAGTADPIDLEKEDFIANFSLVSRHTVQDIDATKTFLKDQIIANDKKLIFKNASGDYGWNFRNNTSNDLIIEKGGSSPAGVLKVTNDRKLTLETKATTLSSELTSISDTTSITLTAPTITANGGKTVTISGGTPDTAIPSVSITGTKGVSITGSNPPAAGGANILLTGYTKFSNNIEVTSTTKLNDSLTLSKRNFVMNLGEYKSGANTLYDWVIYKSENDDLGDLKIKRGANDRLLLDGDGLLNAVKFRTIGNYTLNNLNVEQFNSYTIQDEETSVPFTDTDKHILWLDNDGYLINRITFDDMPKAEYQKPEVGDETKLNGLMTWNNLKKIYDLEVIAGLTTGDSKKLISKINEIEPEHGGGEVVIDSNDILVSKAEKPSGEGGGYVSDTKIKDKIDGYDAELTRIATHLPAGDGTADAGKIIISVKNKNPVWGKITDNQISTTITNVAPKSETPIDEKEYGVAFWDNKKNADTNGLHYDKDVAYDPGNKTLTATNVNSRSSRKLKKDIEIYTKSAFDTLDKIDVVSFHFKDDITQADKVGFIAEDSPSLVAGLNYDKMDINNCVGLLIKAVQELKEENKELRNELNAIKNS